MADNIKKKLLLSSILADSILQMIVTSRLRCVYNRLLAYV